MSTFEKHCSDVVKEYVQTVLIIDDRAGLDGNKKDDSGVDVVEFEEDSENPLSETTAENAQEAEIVEEGGNEEEGEVNTHPLRTLELTNAFYDLGIIAGLYQPQISDEDDPEEFASNARPVLATADIIILDWMLKDHDERYSLAIVKQILEQDRLTGGRLRTILIYTGEPDLNDIRDDLWSFLDDETLNKTNDYKISSENLNITFYNKVDATGSPRVVPEEELPSKAISDFSSLVDGLVPAFAMKATSTIRQNAGRIVSRFGKDLDVAYVAHRALLPNVIDSEPFMLENFSSYIRNLLAISRVDSLSLGQDNIESWLDSIFENIHAKVPFSNNEYQLTLASIKSISVGGIQNNIYNIMSSEHNEIAKSFQTMNSACERVIHVYDEREGSSVVDSSIKLSILRSFRRTFLDIVPDVEVPYLTQGSIVYSLKSSTFLLCVTPKCDTARVTGNTLFSFSTLERKMMGKSFDIVVPSNTEIDENEKDKIRKQLVQVNIDISSHVENSDFITERNLLLDSLDNYGPTFLSTDNKFNNLQHIYFESNTGRIDAYENHNENLVFIDENENEYIWIGDLEDLDTQKRVSNLVGNLNRIGTDEVEWLRRQYN